METRCLTLRSPDASVRPSWSLATPSTSPHSTQGRLVVLDPLSGRELWRKSAGGAFTTTPFMAGDRIWASDRTGILHGWDPRTRRSTAQLPARWSEEGRGHPAVESRMMFVSTSGGWLQA
ncbi:outer membrane protein assembly factor BamB family protein [Streptomyces bungoensis]